MASPYMFLGELKPKYLYRVLPSMNLSWNPFPAIIPRTDPDRDEGYIHLWRSRQIIIPLKQWHQDALQVIVIRVIMYSVQDNTRWDRTPEGDFHPHLCRDLRGDECETAVLLQRTPGQTWEQALTLYAGWISPGV
ncbi:hypothetical protein CALVIDRAFT_215386 [Calocera viscosa TUFC12733]|uniref:Uncharacterized protein n=1 Tax=Calocera viscosa (strain TUFC12733) TaxID=1330018 RepID=A0A167RFA3_CALVF|nr:hypothetical protein CALVIDRAFT_215386 [Calocera viscosa TUFC12733]